MELPLHTPPVLNSLSNGSSLPSLHKWGTKSMGVMLLMPLPIPPLLNNPPFVAINDAYAEWYEHTFGKVLDHSQVLPVLHALQGHPESGCLWEVHIGKILWELKFATTIHDAPSTVLSLVANPSFSFAKWMTLPWHVPMKKLPAPSMARLAKLQLPSELEPPFKYLGLLHDFNGLDVHQYSDSITISCTSYIDHVLKTHGWMTPSAEGNECHSSPLPIDAVNSMYSKVGPSEGTSQVANLSTKHGFSYRSLLGELMYAYVTCHPNVGYAVTTLSKFSMCPHDTHYALLKKVAKYL
jgi:hypothetical protein